MRFLLQFCDETAGKGISVRIAMQTRRNHQERFSGFPGKVAETGRRPPERAEGVLGGAPKGCYGK